MTEDEHLPDKKIKSQTDAAIEAFVDEILEIHPNLEREGFREGIETRVQEYVPDEHEGAQEEGEEEEEKGLIDKAKDKLPGQ